MATVFLHICIIQISGQKLNILMPALGDEQVVLPNLKNLRAVGNSDRQPADSSIGQSQVSMSRSHGRLTWELVTETEAPGIQEEDFLPFY